MKKNIKLLAAFVVISMLAAGCAPKTEVSTENTKIIDATEAIETYKGKTELSFTANSGETEISMGSLAEISLKENPFFADIYLNVHSSGNDEINNSDSRMLLSSQDDSKTVYLLHNNEWNKESVEAKDLRPAAYQYDVVETAILLMESSSNLQKFTTEEYNGVMADKYEGTIPLKLLPNLFKSIGSLELIGTNIGATYFNKCNDQPITIWVDENGVAIGYEMDLTPIVQELFKALYKENNVTDESDMINFSSYIAKGTVSEYNKEIITTIPEEAINSHDVSEGKVDGTIISSGNTETK